MEGRHVGLDFYDLLIEEVKSRCFANHRSVWQCISLNFLDW